MFRVEISQLRQAVGHCRWIGNLLVVFVASAHAQVPVLNAEIARLPTTLYLPNMPQSEIAAGAPGFGDASQVKDLGALVNSNQAFSLAKSNALTVNAAQMFVKENAKELGIVGNAGDLKVSAARETLSGRYVDVEQRYNGLRVIDGQIQIQIADDGTVQSVTRNVVQIPLGKAATIAKKASIDEKTAREIAWKDLQVSGELLEAPQIEKAYLNEPNALTMVYVVRLSVSKPFGYWEHTVDASSGRIISKRDRRVREQKVAITTEPAVAPQSATVAPDIAIKAFESRAKATTAAVATQKAPLIASAAAMVFVPHPVTALNAPTLVDISDATSFDQAYLKVTLEGLRKVDDKFTLDGTLIRIEDFEPGEGGAHRAPSTASSVWSARRGDNAFNDVMTYFHIHNSLVYLRRLGYVGAKELFPNGIAADSDGVNGEDNSHYVPNSDRLAFGHGCVDDNEDADVILHELGHAITYHLNPKWGGGDSGAIGEGFGDYWALSQRLRMSNGWAVNPGKVFVWDGIDACWGGRRADRTGLVYDSNTIYSAHLPIGNIDSAELWSTPLVRALLELTSAGESPESVDTVVLEGMRAIGFNFTMRSLALKTVEQAKGMFPGRAHASVLEKHFRNVGLIASNTP